MPKTLASISQQKSFLSDVEWNIIFLNSEWLSSYCKRSRDCAGAKIQSCSDVSNCLSVLLNRFATGQYICTHFYGECAWERVKKPIQTNDSYLCQLSAYNLMTLGSSMGSWASQEKGPRPVIYEKTKSIYVINFANECLYE